MNIEIALWIIFGPILLCIGIAIPFLVLSFIHVIATPDGGSKKINTIGKFDSTIDKQ